MLDPLRPEPILSKADAQVVHCTEAKAALETALLDLSGKALGQVFLDASELHARGLDRAPPLESQHPLVE